MNQSALHLAIGDPPVCRLRLGRLQGVISMLTGLILAPGKE
jgi:hypothetical protein